VIAYPRDEARTERNAEWNSDHGGSKGMSSGVADVIEVYGPAFEAKRGSKGMSSGAFARALPADRGHRGEARIEGNVEWSVWLTDPTGVVFWGRSAT
jgi:hypothetical protein